MRLVGVAIWLAAMVALLLSKPGHWGEDFDHEGERGERTERRH